MTRIPVLGCEVADLCDDSARENFSEALAREHLRDNPSVAFSSDDDRQVISVGVELLHQIEHACTMLEERYEKQADQTRVTDRAVDADDRHAERNMERGRHVFVRVDVYRKGQAVAIRVGVSNPKNVVGIAENMAREYALITARCANYMAKELNGKGHGERISLVCGDGCDGIFALAEETEARLARRRFAEWTNARRFLCARHRNGYCAPICVKCRHYENGKCVEVKI